MRELTTQEHDALAKIVTDPVAWWANATASRVDEEAALAAKLARWEGKHTNTKAERDAADEAERNTPLTIAQQLAASDALLPRWGEDILDALEANGISVSAETKAKAAAKKALRVQL